MLVGLLGGTGELEGEWTGLGASKVAKGSSGRCLMTGPNQAYDTLSYTVYSPFVEVFCSGDSVHD